MSKFQKIKPSDTTIDSRFQRDLDEQRARAMARAFNPDLVGVPVVSHRENGEYVRLDGQHRLAAAEMANRGEIPTLMEVHVGLSLREEAELFLRLNGGRSPVRVFDKFKARLVAHEPVALAIVAILKLVGLKIVKTSQRFGVCAIKAVELVHHKGNLEKTMRVLSAWADGGSESYEGPLVKAMSAFLAEYPNVEVVEIADRLHSHDPNKVIQRLRRTIGSYECKPDEAARIVLRDIYNERRKKGLLPPPGREHAQDAAE